MTRPARVLLLDAVAERAAGLSARLEQRGLAPVRLAPDELLGAHPHANAADVAVAVADAGADPASLRPVIARLAAENVATIICGPGTDALRRESGPLIEWAPPDASLDELAGKAGTLARCVPLLRGLERELRHLQRLGEHLNRYFGEIDQEMRLAGRLQHDFLPRELPRLGPIRFEAFYRPASWVSGDLYDVFRVDEHHVGMFIADAMGHGVAAGLLTMFLRQALVPKRVHAQGYTVVAPTEALSELHECLLRQKLPSAQFVTAAYGLLDIRSCEVRLARAGHPFPLHISAAGEITEIRSGGSLLGLADVAPDFEEARVALRPGDKLIFYTDGLEDALLVPQSDTATELAVFTPALHDWSRLTASDFLLQLADHLDNREGSLHPADDMTMVLLEVSA